MREAILIVNMGGPESSSEVRPYLRAIFRDPNILPMPGPLRTLIGEMIVARRAGKVAHRYDLVGGGSPLPRWTRLLEANMRDGSGEKGKTIAHAFRYTSPTIPEAMAALKREGVERVILLPLFPHWTKAMSGSVHVEAVKAATREGLDLRPVPAWGLHPAIVTLQRDYLRGGLEAAGEGARVLFVAHGIPQRSVDRGEDYPDQVRRNAEKLAADLPSDIPWTLAYQSRVGPVQWTGPYLEDELKRLAASPEPVVIMPLSFVADCLETLYDLDLVAVPELLHAGVRDVVRMPAFNDDPRFARALLTLVEEMTDA